jgi:hypothetical protein
MLAAVMFSLLASARSEETPAPEESKKVYTNDDLDARRGPRPARPTPTATPAAESPPPTAVPTDTPSPEELWRMRLEVVQRQVEQAEANVKAKEEEIAALKSPFRPGADPYGWYRSHPDLPRLERELADARERLTRAQTEATEMEEAARRSRDPIFTPTPKPDAPEGT